MVFSSTRPQGSAQNVAAEPPQAIAASTAHRSPSLQEFAMAVTNIFDPFDMLGRFGGGVSIPVTQDIRPVWFPTTITFAGSAPRGDAGRVRRGELWPAARAHHRGGAGAGRAGEPFAEASRSRDRLAGSRSGSKPSRRRSAANQGPRPSWRWTGWSGRTRGVLGLAQTPLQPQEQRMTEPGADITTLFSLPATRGFSGSTSARRRRSGAVGRRAPHRDAPLETIRRTKSRRTQPPSWPMRPSMASPRW